MTDWQEAHSPTPVRNFLLIVAGIFAIAATFLIVLSTTAATVTGQTPFASISLVDGVNTGILGPGEQRWFKFKPDQQIQMSQKEQSLTVMFTPGDGNRIRDVNMQIFEEKQLAAFSRDGKKMSNLGAGQIVSRDNNPETGELFWNGWLFGEQSYYIQLANNSDIPVDYWLFTEDIISYPLNEPETDSQARSESVPMAAGTAPQMAVPLQFGQNQGSLDPGEAIWYSFAIDDAGDEFFEEMALTMIVTPDDGNRIRNVTFDIFTAASVQGWSPVNEAHINNIGAGSIVYRDENPLTGERFWTGWVVEKELYYIQVRNGSDARMDYWLFTGDIYNSNLGGNTAVP